jgi:hypothetical protein
LQRKDGVESEQDRHHKRPATVDSGVGQTQRVEIESFGFHHGQALQRPIANDVLELKSGDKNEKRRQLVHWRSKVLNTLGHNGK